MTASPSRPSIKRLLASVCLLGVACAVNVATKPSLAIVDIEPTPASQVPQYQKVEIGFRVVGTVATMMHWPFDPAPPKGVPTGSGISVDAILTDPDGRTWKQPAFYAERFVDDVKDGRDWHLPTGVFEWRVRFTPTSPGSWRYRLVATDRSGTTESSDRSIKVVPSAGSGFVRVSRADTRYFEFDDGRLFTGLGVDFSPTLANPSTKGGPAYRAFGRSGINFLRLWISGIYGSAWPSFIGGRNQYIGYLPVTGLVPYRDDRTNETSLAMRLDYEAGGDTGWFDACRLQATDDRVAIKPGTSYRVRVEYRGEGITGPRKGGYQSYGLVAKIGGWSADCYEPGTSTPVTGYGHDTSDWTWVEGTWRSGDRSFLPKLHVALENVRGGAAYVRTISVREELGNGDLGLEVMPKPSMEHHLAIPGEKAHALDRIVELAEQNGVYLKLVVMDKDDKIYKKMLDNGEWATADDNPTGFYGAGRRVNHARWLQQTWWRYLQARWGYSPNIHSWELTNEADPASVRHYELADEFGKFMRCRVFGVEPGPGDGARCTLDHPNRHLVTTSMWHSFPAAEFWGNSKYPNVDYADLHAYVSTSYAPQSEKAAMQWDAARYHLWHSANVADWKIGKPVVRGEAGLDRPGQQSETALGLDRDWLGLWLHNFLWSTLDSGGLYELYWWTSHIWNDTSDHRAHFKAVGAFLGDVPLNKGGYIDWGGTVTNPALRVVGQKNTAAGSMHLWVQNRQHTWKNAVDGAPASPESGEVVVPGFKAGAAYAIEQWDTYAPGGRILRTERLVADAGGRLHVTVKALPTDVAFKVRMDSPR